jgi:hypothetical protein
MAAARRDARSCERLEGLVQCRGIDWVWGFLQGMASTNDGTEPNFVDGTFALRWFIFLQQLAPSLFGDRSFASQWLTCQPASPRSAADICLQRLQLLVTITLRLHQMLVALLGGS